MIKKSVTVSSMSFLLACICFGACEDEQGDLQTENNYMEGEINDDVSDEDSVEASPGDNVSAECPANLSSTTANDMDNASADLVNSEISDNYDIMKSEDGQLSIFSLDESADACEEGTRGEDLSFPNKYGLTTKTDCVYIDWCNEPGSREVVCKCKSSSCSNAAKILECIKDADYVCGNWSTAHLDC